MLFMQTDRKLTKFPSEIQFWQKKIKKKKQEKKTELLPTWLHQLVILVFVWSHM